MYAGGEGLHCQDTGLKLILAQNDDGARGLVGGFEGLFEPEGALAELDPEPLVSQFACQNQGCGIESLRRAAQ